ncbi:MAG: DUF1460 domain-containing protein [Bacteroidia bacterium]
MGRPQGDDGQYFFLTASARLRMKRPRLAILLLFAALSATASAQTVWCTAQDRDLCERQLHALDSLGLHDQPMAQIVATVGQGLLGLPYVAQTLEVGDTEQLVVNLREMDCTTFLENVVAFSRLAARDSLGYEAFLRELEGLRYREGAMAGYPSRLHYFSDWIYVNAQKGLLTDITAAIGGQPYTKRIDFMSTHTGSYRQLADSSFVVAIRATEGEINSRRYHYIPKAGIAAREDSIRDGDLIAITTSVAGLDIAHVGLAIHRQGRLHLLHASSRSMRVEISEQPLADYLAASRSQTGIMVCRLHDPRR